jgi:glycosyltransferase involved in cell wall biosynthesis
MNELPPISVCIVARNEEKNLPRLLESVSGLASEIVLLLNNTTDSSAEIGARYGARVVHRPWIGYRDTKNVALELATEPWVLALDADEEVSVALKEEMLEFFSKELPLKYAGARFPRKTWFLGRWIRHGDWYPDRQLRLFRRDAGHWGGSPEHDKIELEGPCLEMREELHHFSNPTIGSYVGKINIFSDYFLKRQLEKKATWSVSAAVFRAWWRFVRAYFLRLGLLDGFPGLFIAASTAYATFVRYSRLYEHLHNNPPPVQAPSRDIGG